MKFLILVPESQDLGLESCDSGSGDLEFLVPGSRVLGLWFWDPGPFWSGLEVLDPVSWGPGSWILGPEIMGPVSSF